MSIIDIDLTTKTFEGKEALSSIETIHSLEVQYLSPYNFNTIQGYYSHRLRTLPDIVELLQIFANG